jgi:predicted nucleotide-binding protein
MKDVVDDLITIASKCAKASARIEKEPLKTIVKKLTDAVEAVAPSSTNSWIGYQSRVYYRGFRRPPANDLFSTEWGFSSTFAFPVSDNWQEIDYEDVERHILRLAGNPDTLKLERAGDAAAKLFEKEKESVTSIFAVLVDQLRTTTLEELRDEAKKIKTFNASQILDAQAPESVMTRDAAALDQGITPPHHVRFYVETTLQHQMPFQALKQLAEVARKAVTYVQRSHALPKPSEHSVFIGHGRSPVWKDLRDFLERRLHLKVEEFNGEPVAGVTVSDRIDEMLDRCTFAFLLMTGEDEHADTTLHARENVIHETGRAQQKLGSRRAIVLLEEGCKTFSNLQGIVYIEFPKGKIRTVFEDLREVLEREQIIPA